MGTIKAVIIEPSGAVSAADIDGERISPYIGGGFVETIATYASGEEVSVCFDEEGKFKDLPDNPAATGMLTYWLGEEGRSLMPGDVLSGTVVVTGGGDAQGRILGLSPAAIEFVTGYLR